MDYLQVKQLHQGLALLTIVFFIWRASRSIVAPGSLPRWAKVLPHIIDTALLAAGLWLMVQLGLSPLHSGWLAAKIIALVLYIALGTFAIKRGRTPKARALAAVGAVLVFIYIVGVAIHKSPWAWFSAV